MSPLDGIQPAALQELDEILEKQFSGGSNVKSSALGGAKKAADILNFVDGAIESKVIEQISEADEELSQEIQDNMFVFEKPDHVDDRGMNAAARGLIRPAAAGTAAARPTGRKVASKEIQDDFEAAAPPRQRCRGGAEGDQRRLSGRRVAAAKFV